MNYNKVMFWDKVDQDVKDLSPEDSARVRAQREVEFQKIVQREEDPGLMNCITNAEQSASKAEVACMQKAKTPAALTRCQESN